MFTPFTLKCFKTRQFFVVACFVVLKYSRFNTRQVEGGKTRTRASAPRGLVAWKNIKEVIMMHRNFVVHCMQGGGFERATVRGGGLVFHSIIFISIIITLINYWCVKMNWNSTVILTRPSAVAADDDEAALLSVQITHLFGWVVFREKVRDFPLPNCNESNSGAARSTLARCFCLLNCPH